MANQPNLIPMPWAASNTVSGTIPETTVEAGKASWVQGFPIETGIPLTQGGIPPKYSDFNAILKILSEFAIFAQSGGQYAWSNQLDYSVGSLVLGSDGYVYRCSIANGPSSAVRNPVGDTTGRWEKIISQSDIAALQAQVDGATSAATIAQSAATDAQTAVTALDGAVVKTTGNQSVAGTKTYTGSAVFSGGATFVSGLTTSGGIALKIGSGTTVIPATAASNTSRFLRGDGTWADIGGGSAVTYAASAGIAEKVGSSSVGTSAMPVYISAGKPVAVTAVASATNAASAAIAVTAVTATSAASAGVATSAGIAGQLGSATVGTATKPIYISSGIPVSMAVVASATNATTAANATSATTAASATSATSAVVATKIGSATVGTTTKPVYISAGFPVSMAVVASASAATSATNATKLGNVAASEYVTMGGTQTISGAKTFTNGVTISGGVDMSTGNLNFRKTYTSGGVTTSHFAQITLNDRSLIFGAYDQTNGKYVWNITPSGSATFSGRALSAGTATTAASCTGNAATATTATTATTASKLAVNAGASGYPVYFSGGIPVSMGAVVSATNATNAATAETATKAGTLTSALPISLGGTGQTTVASARRALFGDNLSANANYFIGITTSYASGGYITIANAKSILGITAAGISSTLGTTAVASAAVATKLGTANKGGAGIPIYLSAGSPVAIEKVNSAGNADYADEAGVATKLGTQTVGANGKPVFFSNGYPYSMAVVSSATNATRLGGSAASVYAKDSLVLHKSGSEVVTGAKTFSGGMTIPVTSGASTMTGGITFSITSGTATRSTGLPATVSSNWTKYLRGDGQWSDTPQLQDAYVFDLPNENKKIGKWRFGAQGFCIDGNFMYVFERENLNSSGSVIHKFQLNGTREPTYVMKSGLCNFGHQSLQIDDRGYFIGQRRNSSEGGSVADGRLFMCRTSVTASSIFTTAGTAINANVNVRLFESASYSSDSNCTPGLSPDKKLLVAFGNNKTTSPYQYYIRIWDYANVKSLANGADASGLYKKQFRISAAEHKAIQGVGIDNDGTVYIVAGGLNVLSEQNLYVYSYSGTLLRSTSFFSLGYQYGLQNFYPGTSEPEALNFVLDGNAYRPCVLLDAGAYTAPSAADPSSAGNRHVMIFPVVNEDEKGPLVGTTFANSYYCANKAGDLNFFRNGSLQATVTMSNGMSITTAAGNLVLSAPSGQTIRVDNHFRPTDEKSGTVSLGTSQYRFYNCYLTGQVYDGSDVRLKDDISDVSEALMRAWGKVNFKIFHMKDEIAKYGDAARWRVGVIAQQIIEAFQSEGLDALDYGLIEYSEWDDEYEDGELIRPAGNVYNVAYTQALAIESAYQRWRLDKLETVINGASHA